MHSSRARSPAKSRTAPTCPRPPSAKEPPSSRQISSGLLDPNDPDQKYALLSNFGLSDLVPSLNIHVQSALEIQDSFEKWVEMPQGPTPLVIKPWFDLQIHLSERIKWLNSDKMRELMTSNPVIEQIVTQHLQELQFILAPPPMLDENGQPLPQGPGGPPQAPQSPGGQAMKNSNTHSGAPSSVPKGNAQAPNSGPAQMGPA
jgi:hypothetical protein